MPVDLITRIVQFRVLENVEKARKKKPGFDRGWNTDDTDETRICTDFLD